MAASAEALTAGDVAAGEPAINPSNKPATKPSPKSPKKGAPKSKGRGKGKGGGLAKKAGAGAAATGTAVRNLGTGRTTPATAKKVVLFAVVVSGGVVVLYDLKQSKLPSVRLGVGVLFAGVMLSALADVVPEVAAPLGLLVLVGVLLVPQSGGKSPGAELLSSIRSIVPAGGVRGA